MTGVSRRKPLVWKRYLEALQRSTGSFLRTTNLAQLPADSGWKWRVLNGDDSSTVIGCGLVAASPDMSGIKYFWPNYSGNNILFDIITSYMDLYLITCQ